MKYKTEREVFERALQLVGKRFGDIDKTKRLETGKGGVGAMIEENWFGITPNNRAEPDFAEAGVELKATPFIKKKDGTYAAKERLVCNIINYMTEYQKTFRESDFWHKCKRMLILSYEYKKDLPKSDYEIAKAILFSFPVIDLIIIEQDWKTIIQKIKSGNADKITEGDTFYLAACTKGANSETVREQPFSKVPAKQRAYSLKPSYMTRVLNEYVFGNKTDENIITEADQLSLEKNGFEKLIKDKVSPYFGKTEAELASLFGVDKGSKHIRAIILARMLNLTCDVENAAEFKNANILVKTVRVQYSGVIKESMSFPYFKFKEVAEQEWEDSDLCNYLEPAKFLFAVFRENENGENEFRYIKFWNIPYDDLCEVQRVWERTKQILNSGVELTEVNGVQHNNLPKSTESPICHVRPHARNKKDTDTLPDGREMPKQCFWFNQKYVKKIIQPDYKVTPGPVNIEEKPIEYTGNSKRVLSKVQIIPCGAIVYHSKLGFGTVVEIAMNFGTEDWMVFPYRTNEEKPFTILADGMSVNHKEYGEGKISYYTVQFSQSKCNFTLEDIDDGILKIYG